MAVTIRDVAAAAQVSPATVSRVLNGKVEVAEELRQRVVAAVGELGYRPNGLARSLRTRATSVLGVVIADVTNPFFTAMVRGIEDVAQAAGYSVVLANSDEDLDKERRYLEVAAAEQMAGVVLAPASSRGTDVSLLQQYRIPLVTVDRQLAGLDVDSVSIDNQLAAREATEHLVAQGCRRIAFVSGPSATSTGQRRLAGYRAALRAADLPSGAELVKRADFRAEGGYDATIELLRSAERPDGLLVSNNLMALGALRALQEMGIDVPGEIAFASFDGIEWARALRPTLTVVEQPTYEIGRRAAELLLARVAGETGPAQRVVLPAELKVGESSTRR
ncbi:LacI family DNA-binding transcriptional regulator [Nocardioides sp. CER19]|uniref:LacI family DNA-binding transcriptional regulator n=1 Tax=Nocardioides sp. CER19 TaxID=3038538 RepID=UPI002447B7E9|nr:LacI family DNA-binding transcriptional regulator [Nocardioides sp. CER19]MDH2414309.1 LacI family DNA-binding transcriptional regulator [Nocardioides sp. CER19]